MSGTELIILIALLCIFFFALLYYQDKADKKFYEDYRLIEGSVDPFDPTNFEVIILRENKSGERYYKIKATDKYLGELKQRDGNINKH